MNFKINFFLLLALVFMVSCEPKEEDKIELNQIPNASFSVDFIDENNIRFTNTTTDDFFITNWDMGTFGTFSDEVVEVNFSEAGTYPVKLTVFGQGGSNTSEQMITITQDDPSACSTVSQYLTCGGRTWKLNPAAGALWVGPDPTTTWWENTQDDVTGRDCDWNDVYSFTSDGVFTYEANGDLWGESYSGFSADQCYSTAELSADRAAWDSGVHSFEVIPADADNPAKLKVIGTGAFIGLRKAANGSEVNFPQEQITYDITDMRTESGVDLLELTVDFGGGLWRFTLASE